MKRLRDNALVYYSYTYEHEDGFKQSHHYLHLLLPAVKEYRRANNLPIGTNFNDEFEENLCRHNPREDVCIDFTPPTLAEKASQLASALVRWARTGFKVRDEATVESIRAICRECEFYGGERGLLKIFCKKCGCSGKKQYLISEHCPLYPPKW